MKLKPCPFCFESECAVLQIGDLYDGLDSCSASDWTVRCNFCGSQGETCSTRQGAIIAWNTRHRYNGGIVMNWDRIEKNLKAHRDEAKITCPNDCWCWDMEILCDVYGPSDDVLGETLKHATEKG